MTRAVNVDALVAEVNTLTDELEAVLALGADPAALEAANDLTDRLNDLTLALTYAEVAGRIVVLLQDRLQQRGGALVEVHGLTWDALHSPHVYPRGVIRREFGPRFDTPYTDLPDPNDDPTDEDLPF